MQSQDLLFVQMFQVATLSWLRQRGLPAMHFVAAVDGGSGTLEMNFGFPAAIPEQHAELLQSWIDFSKKAERLHLLMQFLAEGRKKAVDESILKDWQAEGEILTAELFNHNLSVYATREDAINALSTDEN